MTVRRFGPYAVEITREEKVLFPDSRISKGDLVAYYEAVATHMLRYLQDRPLSLHRFPDGIEEEGFFQKETPNHFPDWIRRARVPLTGGGSQEQVVVANTATLVYLANQGTITPHVWMSRTDALEQPDRMVLDLDPSGDDFGPVRTAARLARGLLSKLGLHAYFMTTGSTGGHVWVPIRRGPSFDEVRAFARQIAESLARDHPEDFTTEVRKAQRDGRLYLDSGRNAYGQTATAPYAVRPLPGAPVATPLDWEELDRSRLNPGATTSPPFSTACPSGTTPGRAWDDMGAPSTTPGRSSRRYRGKADEMTEPTRNASQPESPEPTKPPPPGWGPGRPPGKPGGPKGPALGTQSGCLQWVFWPFLVAVLYLGFQQFLGGTQGGDAIDYSSFRSQLTSGNVVSVTVRGPEVRGTLKSPFTKVVAGDTTQVTDFVTFIPSFGDTNLLELLEQNNVDLTTLPPQDTSWLNLLVFGLLPFVLLGGLLYFSMRRSAGAAQSLFSIGRSGARRYEREESATTFDDVGGAAGAKRELREIVDFLKHPERFHRLGAEVPKGVLLVGPPGTGKTLLARAVAGEADVSFFIITGSDFMEMFVGVGAKRVRDLFDQAKKASPSIIFIDELDSIGRHRGAGLGGGHDEREQTLNQLLSALDGFEPTHNVIVMAATNRPDILDPALLRPGRFDRRITVDLPSAMERLEILRLHARHMPLDPGLDLEPAARGTPGFSGADLKNLLNEAALIAARNEQTQIDAVDLEAARDRILMGLKREGLALTQEEMRLLAYHEGGHALVAAALPNIDPVHKVTIIPRGRAMGSTHQLPERERYLWKREDLMDQLAMTLGGRAAENLVFDTATSGAEDDLDKATKLARTMVVRWGMSTSLGPFASAAKEGQVFLGEELTRQRDHSDETAREVDQEVRRILGDAADRAREILEVHREALDKVAELLLEKEEITGAEVVSLLG